MFAKTPQPPYYAAIFTSRRTEGDNGYAAAAQELVRLAEQAPGFLGAESVRAGDGAGITVSYWTSLEAIEAFRNQPRHVEVRGRMCDWYAAWSLRVCRVERASQWPVTRS